MAAMSMDNAAIEAFRAKTGQQQRKDKSDAMGIEKDKFSLSSNYFSQSPFSPSFPAIAEVTFLNEIQKLTEVISATEKALEEEKKKVKAV